GGVPVTGYLLLPALTRPSQVHSPHDLPPGSHRLRLSEERFLHGYYSCSSVYCIEVIICPKFPFVNWFFWKIDRFLFVRPAQAPKNLISGLLSGSLLPQPLPRLPSPG